MNYLKSYKIFESISELLEKEMVDTINDILLDLRDVGFEIKILKDKGDRLEMGKTDYEIYIKNIKPYVKWIDVKYPIYHVLSYMEEFRYFWGVSFNVPKTYDLESKMLRGSKYSFESRGNLKRKEFNSARLDVLQDKSNKPTDDDLIVGMITITLKER